MLVRSALANWASSSSSSGRWNVKCNSGSSASTGGRPSRRAMSLFVILDTVTRTVLGSSSSPRWCRGGTLTTARPSVRRWSSLPGASLSPKNRAGSAAPVRLRLVANSTSIVRPVGAGPALLRVATISTSARRFLARPAAVLLSATGCLAPLPWVWMRLRSIPCITRYDFTACARLTDSAMACGALPASAASAWPTTMTASRFVLAARCANASRRARSGGLKTASPAAKNASAANVTF